MKASAITRTAMLSLLLGLVVLACAAQERPADGKDKDHPKQDSARQQAKPEQQHEQQARPSARQEQPAQQQQRQPAQQQQRQPAQSQRQPAQQQQRQPDQSRRQPAQQQRPDDSQQRAQQAQQEQRPSVSRQQEHDLQHRSAAPERDSQGQRGVRQSAFQQRRAGNWQSDHRTWQQRGGYNGYRVPDDRFRGYFGPEHGFRIEGLPFMVVGGFPRFRYDGYWLSIVDPWPQDWDSDWYDNDQVYVAYVDNGYYLFNRSYPGEGIAVSISM